MGKKRKRYDKEFKSKLVLAALKNGHSIQELSRQYDVSPNLIARWRDRFIDGGNASLTTENGEPGMTGKIKDLENEIEKRDQVIGELTVANKALKKNIYGI